MADLNLGAEFQRLQALDQVADVASAQNVGVLIAGLTPADETFPDAFEVLAFRFRRNGHVVGQDHRRLVRFGDRFLPFPKGLRLTPEGVVKDADGVQADTAAATVRRLEGISTGAHSATCSGTFLDSSSNANQQFVAIASPNAKEFRIEILGSFTEQNGAVYSVHFAGDGGVLPEAHTDNGFSAQLDGGILRVQTGSGDGISISESAFASINRIRLRRQEDTAALDLTGTASVDGTTRRVEVNFSMDRDNVRVSIADEARGYEIFSAISPRERAMVKILGGEKPDARDGFIVIHDRSTGAEIRRIPVSGRLTGLTYDGQYLWQALWPSGRLLKFDPNVATGPVGELTTMAGQMIAGVAADGGRIVVAQCRQDIMRSTGETTINVIDPATGAVEHTMPRPHIMSSGLAASERGYVGVVNGADQTPVSSECALLVLNKNTGEVEETIVFPRNFFIEDVHQEAADRYLVTVTEGLSGFAKHGSLWEVILPPRL